MDTLSSRHIISLEVWRLLVAVVSENKNFWDEKNQEILVRVGSLLHMNNISELINKLSELFDAKLLNNEYNFNVIKVDLLARFYPTHWPQIKKFFEKDFTDEKSLIKNSPSSGCTHEDLVFVQTHLLQWKGVNRNNHLLLSAMLEKYENEVNSLWNTFARTIGFMISAVCIQNVPKLKIDGFIRKNLV